MGSPEELAAEFMAGVELHYAGHWRRLAAFILDGLIAFSAASLLTVGGVLLANLATSTLTDGRDFIRVPIFIVGLSLGLVAVGIYVLYFPILEGRFGQTVGKRLFGLRVVREDGLSIGLKEAFLRRIPFYFRFAVLDAIFVFFTAKRQRAFDICCPDSSRPGHPAVRCQSRSSASGCVRSKLVRLIEGTRRCDTHRGAIHLSGRR